MKTNRLIVGIGLLGLILSMSANGLMALSEYEGKKIPSYAGFADIKHKKNLFALVGDTQKTSYWELWRERNNQERKLITDEIVRHNPAFVIHLGDLTARGGSESHWRDFDEMHKVYREKRIPYFPVLGNHELKGKKAACLQNYFGRFPHLKQRRWYSFTWKKIAFIMVDSNFSSLTPAQIKEQSQWYLAELARFEKKADVDYVLVCCHHPPFTNSLIVSPSQEVKRYFADPFLRFRKTRLFFSGHNHSYERFQRDGKFFIVSGGGGGPRHKVALKPAKDMYPDQFKGPALRFFHFCEIEAGKKELSYRVIRVDSDGTSRIVDNLKIPCKPGGK
jgi:3',5'-cyclic AMP phosphodiesterase CpdA